MLTENELMEIGERESKAMYSKEFLQKYRKNGVFGYGLDDDRNVISCVLGLSTDAYLSKFEYHMGGETPNEFVAVVNIDPETGAVTRDYENSRLPK